MKDILKLFKGQRVFLISPHLDDAVLSCGTLMLQLKDLSEVTVINVFTEAHSGPYTLSARKFLQLSQNFYQATALFATRRAEDELVLSEFKIKVINLGLIDALFRKKTTSSLASRIIPELNHIYPTYRLHVLGKISSFDTAPAELAEALKKNIPPGSVILAPLGISGHVDHTLVSRVCESLFPNTIFYSEFPYNVKSGNYGAKNGYRQLELKTNTEKIDPLISYYGSQLNSLFPNGKILPHKEVYFSPQK